MFETQALCLAVFGLCLAGEEEDDDWLLEQVEELLVRAGGGAGW